MHLYLALLPCTKCKGHLLLSHGGPILHPDWLFCGCPPPGGHFSGVAPTGGTTVTVWLWKQSFQDGRRCGNQARSLWTQPLMKDWILPHQLHRPWKRTNKTEDLHFFFSIYFRIK